MLASFASAQESRYAWPDTFVKIAKTKTKGVINISTTSREELFDERTRQFYERLHPYFQQLPKERLQKGLGSGFVIEADGYILTNNHVIDNADEIIVTFGDANGNGHGNNGGKVKEYRAELIGSDPKTDVALIKIKPDQPLTPLELGNSDKVDVGQWVMAIGNPFGFAQSVTVGVVSAKGRVIGAGPYDDFIQTDASINPGNSGGPLLDIDGKVIGINTAIFAGGGSGNIGIGFAIPINSIREIYSDLKKGKVRRGWLGVNFGEVLPDIAEALHLPSTEGALISNVMPDSPASKGGLKRYDVIITFGDQPVVSHNSLPKLVGSKSPGDKVGVTVLRDGKKERLTITLGELPNEKPIAATAPAKTGATEKLGLTVTDITADIANRIGAKQGEGVVVTQVNPTSPAGDAGLRQRDVILEVNRVAVTSVATFGAQMEKSEKGGVALLVIRRGMDNAFITLRIPE
jgi:serine protease Do